ERLLRRMGVNVTTSNGSVRVRPPERLAPLNLEVPGDMSAASFWLVAGGLVRGSRIRMPQVGLNPTRTAFLDLLRRAGFAIAAGALGDAAGEPVGWLEVSGMNEPRPVTVDGETAAAVIDELPVLAVAATQLPGTSRIRGAAELKVKESDRIAAMAEGLSAMGAEIKPLDDGWRIPGLRDLRARRHQAIGGNVVSLRRVSAA